MESDKIQARHSIKKHRRRKTQIHKMHQDLARRDMSDFRTLPSLSYHKPIPNYSYSDCGPVIEYSFAVVIVVHFKRGLEWLNALISFVYTEFSIFYIFMLYILIHTVLAVEFVVVLLNRVYNLCTLYVLKGVDRG